MDQRVLNDDGRPKKFTLSERFVILSIFGMAVLSGISNAVEHQIILDSKVSLMGDGPRGILSFITPQLIPLPGIFALAFFSELKGRKPVFITLCAISVLSAILAVTPVSWPVLMVNFILTITAKGGLAMMAMICIPEYCRPRHRFTYLVVYCIAVSSGVWIGRICLWPSFIPIIYFEIYMIVLSVACLAFACFWPESPYWLAARGRCADAAITLRKLRGESAGSELNQLSELRNPGPSKVYYRCFICVLGLSSVETFAAPLIPTLYLCVVMASGYFIANLIIVLVGSSCLLILTAVVSYKVKRRSIYLVSAFASLVTVYTLALWIYLNSHVKSIIFHIFITICQIIITSGTGALIFVVASEIMPQRFNTVLACCYQVSNYIFLYVISLFHATYVDMPDYIQIVEYITLTVPGLVIGYFLVPDTKNKTLFGIQKSYTPEETETPEQGQMLENVNTFSEETSSKRLT